MYPSFIVPTETWNTTVIILMCNLKGYHVEHTIRVLSDELFSSSLLPID